MRHHLEALGKFLYHFVFVCSRSVHCGGNKGGWGEQQMFSQFLLQLFSTILKEWKMHRVPCLTNISSIPSDLTYLLIIAIAKREV